MIIHIVGTRPNFIKCAELVKTIKRLYPEEKQHVVDTSQHFSPSMKESFLKGVGVASIPVMERLIGSMTEYLSSVVGDGKIIVYGDCRSSLSGALVAYEKQLPLYHVEAGLRCGNLLMLEERARIAIDGMSNVNFCPSDRENKNVSNGVVTGDIMYDIFLRESKKTDTVGHDFFVFVTLHRKEILEKEKLCEILEKIKKRFKGYEIMMSLHPHTREILGRSTYPGINMFDPMNHQQTLSYIEHANFVVTDSGGVSKEAAWFKKKLYVVRDVSEWGLPTIGEDAHGLDEDPKDYKPLESGDGKASEKMAKSIIGG